MEVATLNDRLVSRLKDEVDFLLELKDTKHPNFMQVYEVFVSATHVSIVTELCEGGDLYGRIVTRPPYREEEAAPIFHELMKAVLFLHSLGIVHRDLKPENILLRTPTIDSQIVLADFGFAKRSVTNMMYSDVGTPDYAAPEILNIGKYTKSVDIWACGAILYFMLFGVPPFYDEDASRTLQKVCAGTSIVFPSNVSANTKDLILGMMDRNPKLRLSALQILHHPWFKDLGYGYEGHVANLLSPAPNQTNSSESKEKNTTTKDTKEDTIDTANLMKKSPAFCQVKDTEKQSSLRRSLNVVVDFMKKIETPEI
jgi:serine/threonine protein kinase